MKLNEIDVVAMVKSLSEASVRLGNLAPMGRSPEFEIYMAQARTLAAIAEAILAGARAVTSKEP